jgi:uncharacterized repeat protein (TIGR01451 family)
MPAKAQPKISPKAQEMIRAIHKEKAARTPAQRKIDPHLLYASRRERGQEVAPGIQDIPGMTKGVKGDASGRVEIDIRGTITDALLRQIQSLGAQVVNSHPQRGAARIRIRLQRLEELASLPEVTSLLRAEQPMTGRVIPTTTAPWLVPQRIDSAQRLATVKSLLPAQIRRAAAGPLLASLGRLPYLGLFSFAGTVQTEGDVAHEADQLRAAGIDGTGINIGVLSDGVDSLNSLFTAGELPQVTVIPNQAGSGTEGTAMLEIIHDMAPGANLFFATGGGGQVQMEANIMALHQAGCQIIVDDIGYPLEAAFQDGFVSIAVDLVTLAGRLYFSSAGNSGNFNDGTSGVWEGNFNPLAIYDGKLAHVFSNGDIGNTILAASSNDSPVTLQWSDPYASSENDYDLYVVDSNGVVCSSTYGQHGADSTPTEWCGPAPAGSRIVVILYDGDAARALHVNTNRGRLQYGTPGQTFGHHAAFNTVTVGAVPVATAAGGVFPGGPTTQVETYSSDGPRRMLYTWDGIPATPGCLTYFCGQELFKVNIAAADCVSTASPGFQPFCGTSAAAPHAAAVGALLWSAKPSATPEELKQAMYYGALDIEEPGWDRDSGYGIVMARRALNLLAPFDFQIGKTHGSAFYQGQTSAIYQINVRNIGASPSMGPVTVTESLPSGLTLASLSGTGWSCATATASCTRSDPLAPNTNYQPITVTVNVSLSSAPSLTNVAALQSALDGTPDNNTASDITVVQQLTFTTATAASGQYSDTTLLRASVIPAVPGTMEFRLDGTLVGSAPVTAGVASLSHVIQAASGNHVIGAYFVSSNPLYLGSSGSATLTVSREDTNVTPLSSNPAAVKVNTAGGTAGPVTLQADIVEVADGGLGDIQNAVPVSFRLIPQLGGTTLQCTAQTSTPTPGTLRAACAFTGLAVNLYLIEIRIGGDYYTGSGSSVLSVYDPSLGFVTGGGSILHNGYHANFGFTLKFLKNGNAQGSLLYIEHQPAGDVKLSSNALSPLVIVGNSAAIQGKAVLAGTGNHSFVATVIDNGDPGANDRFGIQVKDQAGQLIPLLTFEPLNIAGGNIQIPLTPGK